jgi:ankyrin repeat protein
MRLFRKTAKNHLTLIRLWHKTVAVAVIVGGAAVLILGAGCSRRLATHFRSAACAGDIEKVKSLLQLGANVNATDGLGYSALIDVEACQGHIAPTRVELVELLIGTGATVNLRSGNGSAALMYAARNGDTEAVNALLKNGAEVNIPDKEGETALMKAAANSCNEETVRALLSAGADLSARSQGAECSSPDNS